MTEVKTQVFVAEDGGERLDVFLSRLSGLTRSAVEKHIAEGHVLINGDIPAKSGQKVKRDDTVVLNVPPPVDILQKADIPISILYEDDDIAVIDKPQGLTVHPAGGHSGDTLVNALLFNLSSLSGIGGVIRPGIVHRLDKDTSGVMVVAKNDAAHVALSDQLARREVKKQYRAILEGRLKQAQGVIELPIGRDPKNRKKMAVRSDGRAALTKYASVVTFKENTYAAFDILTGRTHQIRVHATALGHAVVGDKVYGHKKQRFNLDGQLLHAYSLSFTHPKSGEFMTFTAPLPAHFVKIYNVLAAESGLLPYDTAIENGIKID